MMSRKFSSTQLQLNCLIRICLKTTNNQGSFGLLVFSLMVLASATFHRCPKCNKKFMSLSSVSRHRSQQNSACAQLPSKRSTSFRHLHNTNRNSELSERDYNEFGAEVWDVDVDAGMEDENTQ